MSGRRDSVPPSQLTAIKEADSRRPLLLQRWLALCGLALIGVTWPLWTSTSRFPRIPWLEALRAAPLWWDPVAAWALVAALLAILLWAPWRESCSRPGWRRWLTALLIAAGGLALLLDQNRLQPWVWQFCWLILIVATTRGQRSLRLARWLTIGIYFWSALSKFDATFLEVMAPDVIAGLLRALPFGIRMTAADSYDLLLWLLPIGELLVAGLLAIPRTRLVGLIASLAMHGSLILALGRWGLDQQPAVLIWNVFFLGQNLLIFAGQSRRPAARRWGLPEAIVAVAVILPALEPLGWLDHWPAWSVYSPGVERVSLLIEAEATDQLPRELQQFLGPPRWRDGRRVLRLDRWALAAMAAPIYPQGRFRAAVALAVIRRYDLAEAARLVVKTRADRWTGERGRRVFLGAEEIAQYVSHFWINTRPRRNPGK